MTSTLDGGRGQRHATTALNPVKEKVPMVPETGWAKGPVWIRTENLVHTGIQSPDLTSPSESLYTVWAIPKPSLLEKAKIYPKCYRDVTL
jgi:hypothetical protein